MKFASILFLLLPLLFSCDRERTIVEQEDLSVEIPVKVDIAKGLPRSLSSLELETFLINPEAGEDTYWLRVSWSTADSVSRIPWAICHTTDGEPNYYQMFLAPPLPKRGRHLYHSIRRTLEIFREHRIELRMLTKPGRGERQRERMPCRPLSENEVIVRVIRVDLRFR